MVDRRALSLPVAEARVQMPTQDFFLGAVWSRQAAGGWRGTSQRYQENVHASHMRSQLIRHGWAACMCKRTVVCMHACACPFERMCAHARMNARTHARRHACMHACTRMRTQRPAGSGLQLYNHW